MRSVGFDRNAFAKKLTIQVLNGDNEKEVGVLKRLEGEIEAANHSERPHRHRGVGVDGDLLMLSDIEVSQLGERKTDRDFEGFETPSNKS